ncbi:MULTISPECIES: 50S ribosomal protein L7/L12 [unclassified Micromonospora]|uniref:50S ribosomal protein L7/L12 n=1 Tax=unclassified Micromonospora TaxID=2617518 RepID=UPI001C219D02|nr:MULTISPECIES: 50S ribosomal protein L7/L12 [unclassified Micromonospora]MBU8859426.1 50S ribosomal protein L7/L12 [Micromonospora sp. WMMB482]MDM4778939.1 50S ribosomal protein L7/L12 [Micromonospora sp. b486]
MSPAVQIALAVTLVVAVLLLVLALRRDRPRDLVAPDRPAGDGQAEVLRLARAGRTVEAVKVLRQQTGLSLLDAKRAVDALAAGGSWSSGAPVPGRGVDDAVRAEAARLLHRGRKIQAIKVVREHTSMSLADAKRYVEGL